MFSDPTYRYYLIHRRGFLWWKRYDIRRYSLFVVGPPKHGELFAEDVGQKTAEALVQLADNGRIVYPRED